MLRGHPGNITNAVKRVIVRLHNRGLFVTSTTDGVHAPGSFHRFGRAVDAGNSRRCVTHRGRRVCVGANPGTPQARKLMVDAQRFLIARFGCGAFLELFGPDNVANCDEGRRITMAEGSALETLHDTHIHVVPGRLLPLPRALRRVSAAAADADRRVTRAIKLRRAQRHIRRIGGDPALADDIFRTADRVNLGYSTLLALFEQESVFLNQYGHDRDRNGNIIWHGKTGRVMVTPENYQQYKAFRERTHLVQGVGPGQLTSEGFQEMAERRGGAWKADVNIQVSAEILKDLIRDLGMFNGYGAYNGGRGNPNEAYAREVMAKRRAWLRRLNRRIR